MELTQAQIDEALKGAEYEGHITGTSLEDLSLVPSNNMAVSLHEDAELNAARAIILQRELNTINEWLLQIAEQYGGFERGKSLTPEHGRIVINAALNRMKKTKEL